MEKVREFFTHTLRTPEAVKLLEGIEKPADLDGIISVYMDVARQLGVPLAQDEIRAYFGEKMNQKGAEGQVDDKEMAYVAGGGDCKAFYAPDGCRLMHDACTTYNSTETKCANTFKPGENCWKNDGCDAWNNSYVGNYCHRIDQK